MRRPTGAAGAQLARHAEPTRQGLPKVWAEICSQPNQSAISGSFFGTFSALSRGVFSPSPQIANPRRPPVDSLPPEVV